MIENKREKDHLLTLFSLQKSRRAEEDRRKKICAILASCTRTNEVIGRVGNEKKSLTSKDIDVVETKAENQSEYIL